MEERELLQFEDVYYVLKEALVDKDGDTVWDIKDKSNNNTFTVHTSSKGELYVTFYKHNRINTSCSFNAIRKICEVLIERGLKPTIKIYYKNEKLIRLCCAVGFRKVKGVKHLYYLKKLK